MFSFPFHRVCFPTTSGTVAFLKKAKHSMPGPDSIPYLAWAKHSEASTIVLYRVMVDLADGIPSGLDFNASLAIFAPKGSRESDSIEVIREADATRPLSLKNTANKTICGALACSLHPLLDVAIHPAQRVLCRVATS